MSENLEGTEIQLDDGLKYKAHLVGNEVHVLDATGNQVAKKELVSYVLDDGIVIDDPHKIAELAAKELIQILQSPTNRKPAAEA
jgi:hypothetical protein